MAKAKNYVTEERFESAMTAIKQEFDLMRSEVNDVQRGIGAIMKIVESIDNRLNDMTDHSPRIKHLEKRVTRIESKVGL